MVTIKKIRWIPMLMIISQIMLTGFVAYWLKNQYDDEKDILHNDLTRIYNETRDQVIDSLLFNQVVEPALKDSFTITMTTSNRLDTLNPNIAAKFRSGSFGSDSDSCSKAIIAISLPDSVRGKAIQSAAASLSFNNHKQDMLLRSVRLFIRQTGDTVAGEGISDFLPGRIDTALFKKLYTEKITQRKYRIATLWTHDTIKDIKGANPLSAVSQANRLSPGKIMVSRLPDGDHNNSSIHISSQLPDYLPAVQIKQAFPYLIRRISPQVLFGLILLILTGSAFYFTNRSLKRQLILNSLRNDFVSNITHELRTPVSTVKVALEALKTYDKVSDPAITREYLDMATQELNRLDQLISKVLDQSLIGEHKQIIQPRLSDIFELTDHVLQAVQPRLTACNAKVNYEHTGTDGMIMVDPIHFQGVLINLIDNSLKYVPDHLVLSIRIWPDKDSVFIEVSDNGPGIPKEYIGRVFDKFFRVPAGNTHNIKGYGLGLSFASLVMEQHQGSISVRNLDRGGCAFTLRFPKRSA